MRSLIGVLVFAALGGGPSFAREVSLPLTAGAPVIRDALVRQLFTEPGERALFWGAPGECSFFYLENPEVETVEGAVRVRAHGEARLGTEMLGGCFSPIVWSGTLEADEVPRLDGWTIRFDVADSNIYDEAGQKPVLTGGLWDRIKESVHPRLASVHVDLGAPFEELRALLPLVLDAPETDGATRILDTLEPRSVAASAEGVTVIAALEVAEVPVSVSDEAPEAPLTDEEIEVFTQRMNEWDAFVTFVVRELGRLALRDETRAALLAVLLEVRHEVIAALEAPSRREEDRVRALFVSAWEQLRPVAEELAESVPGAGALRLTTFVAAGDALAALDEVGPAVGLEISSDGLRRMARMVDPETAGDPLEYAPWVDPKLRLFLGFGSPLAVEPEGGGSFWSWPRRAWAAASGDPSAWKDWIFSGRDDVGPYLERVDALLGETAERAVREKELAGDEARLFRRLLPAAAWQESCWRQFESRQGQVTYIASSQRSVGILQVNERVWRGFYEIEKLRWDIRYNARAGAEILHEYQELVLRRGGTVSAGDVGKTGRAIYAAYNGGPRQLRRYLSGKPSAALARVIDGLFGKKLDTVPKDMSREVARCLVGG